MLLSYTWYFRIEVLLAVRSVTIYFNNNGAFRKGKKGRLLNHKGGIGSREVWSEIMQSFL
jgi:hypothetical protein